MRSDELAGQLAAALAQVVGGLAGLAPDLVDVRLVDGIAARAGRIAAILAGGSDHEIAGTVSDLASAGVIPDDPDIDWWRTPLGRVVAASTGADDAERVTHSVAAAMLGVHPGTVSQLVHRGTLDRHPDGGVVRGSVLMRMVRMDAQDGR